MKRQEQEKEMIVVIVKNVAFVCRRTRGLRAVGVVNLGLENVDNTNMGAAKGQAKARISLRNVTSPLTRVVRRNIASNAVSSSHRN